MKNTHNKVRRINQKDERMENIMDKLEKVEKIREKTGVSYAEALMALEQNDGDILDAIIYIERNGKGNSSQDTARFSSVGNDDEASERLVNATAEYDRSNERDGVDSFFDWVKRVFRKSVDTKFTVLKRNDEVLQVPVLVLVIAMIFAFWIIVPLMIIGLFFDCRYHFEGVDKVTVDVNDFCDRAANGAMDMRNGRSKKAERYEENFDDANADNGNYDYQESTTENVVSGKFEDAKAEDAEEAEDDRIRFDD